MRVLESCAEVVDVEWQMSAGADEARVVQKFAELLGRTLAEARGLDLGEADLPKLLKRAGGILLHRSVHRVELNADRPAHRIREGVARNPIRGECRRTEPARLDEKPSARLREH